MTLLDMSISGAVIIMVIVLIRALAINRLPKKTFLFLWGIALCRLLIPFNMPSPFSAYNLIQQGTETSQMQTGNMIALVSPVIPLPIETPFTEFVKNPINIPLLVWFSGAFLLTAYFSITYILFKREFQMALPVKNEDVGNWLAQMKMKRTITIRQSSRISAPLTYGIWKPIILMPKHTNWEDSKQINYVLAHELVHIRHFDTMTKLLLTAVLCIHWFNPFVWVMYILSNRDMELSCDETVIRSFGDTTKSAYARTLISMEENKSRFTPLCNNFSKNAIEERITAIMKMKRTSVWVTALAVLLVVGTSAIFATSALASNDKVLESPTEQQNTKSTNGIQNQNLVIYDTVEVRHYTDGAAPYVFWSRTNNTDKAITAIRFTMLAFDADGKPLSLPWQVMDSSAGYTYDVLCEWQPVDLKPYSTANSNDGSEEGGWSLGWTIPNDDKELQELFSTVAYVLCCDKQITFDNGEVWSNPDYDKWLETYMGQKVDVSVLENYYAE